MHNKCRVLISSLQHAADPEQTVALPLGFNNLMFVKNEKNLLRDT